MRGRKLLVLAVVAVTALPAGAGTAAGGADGWRHKIDPSLLAPSERPHRKYLVFLDERADLSAARAVDGLDARRIAVVEAKRETAERTQADLRRFLTSAQRAGVVASFHPYWVTNAIAVTSDDGVLRAIAARPEVRRIAADAIIRIPTDQQVNAEATPDWNIDKVGAPAVWDMGIDGTGAVVSSIDTGIDPDHPSIASKYRGADGNEDYAWWDAISHQPSAYDDNSHGTHTMGTMVGGDASGPDPDDIGMAPGATFIAAKAFDDWGGGFESWILEAAEFLTAPTKTDGTDPDPTRAPDVVNNSWGGGSCEAWFDEVLQTWRAMEIAPVFSIGNSGESYPGSPGDRPDALSVGATTIDDEIAYFSSRGPSCEDEIKPEVSAPGQDVRSSVPGGGFDVYSGTSMAAPHIAGTVALLTQASVGTLSIDELETLLAETSLDLGDPGPDNTFGAGRLQAFEAVQIAARGGILEGVVARAGGEPIEGAELTFVGGERTVRVRSRADGSYRARLIAGTYATTVRAFGYLPVTQSIVAIDDQTITQDFTLVDAPIHTVSGTVEEVPLGVPLEGATVSVPGTPLEPVVTDASGAFTIDVPAGVYDFRAERDGCLHAATASVDALAGPTVGSFELERKLDAYGHVCTVVPFVHEPGTTKLPVSGWSDSREVALPFAFDFYGHELSSIWVSSTGYVSTTESADASPADLGVDDAVNGGIFGLWDGLFVRGSARGVYTATYGSAPDRRFVIEYRNFEIEETGDLVNFAIVLFEDGAIEARYRSLEGKGNGVSATVGIEDPTGSVALQFSRRTPALHDAMTIRYEDGPFGALAGTVTSAVDGLPVAGARISAAGRTTRSAPDGTYRLSAFPGTHAVTFEADGYGTAAASQAFANGSTATLDVALDAPAIAVPDEITLESSGDEVTATLSVSNVGTRPLTFEVGEAPAAGILPTIIDEPGDASIVDVETVAGSPEGGALSLALRFAPGVDFDEAGGYMFVDVDEDPDTGTPPEDFYGSPGQDIGLEFLFDMFALWREEVDVWTDDFDYVGSVPATIDGEVVTFAVPLEMLGDDDGELDVAAVMGDWWAPRDWIPDAGHGDVSMFHDVGWLSVSGPGGTLAPGSSTDLTVTIDPTALKAGESVARILFATDDPRRPTIATDVRVVLHDAVAPTSSITSGIAGAPVAVGLVVGTASDAVGSIDRVVVGFEDVLTGASTELVAEMDCYDEGGEYCDWWVAPPASGMYSITSTAHDTAGNVQDPPARADMVVVRR